MMIREQKKTSNDTTAYSKLVHILSKPISPQTRAEVLERLVEMNNRLLDRMNENNCDRNMQYHVKRKDMPENPHPSLNLGEHYPRVNRLPQDSARVENDEYDTIVENIISGENNDITRKLNKIQSLYDKLVSDNKKR